MNPAPLVPAKAGTQSHTKKELDSRLRGNERKNNQCKLGPLRNRVRSPEVMVTSKVRPSR